MKIKICLTFSAHGSETILICVCFVFAMYAQCLGTAHVRHLRYCKICDKQPMGCNSCSVNLLPIYQDCLSEVLRAHIDSKCTNCSIRVFVAHSRQTIFRYS